MKMMKRIALKSLSYVDKSFFSTFQSSFMPINEPNLDSSYILDFGDVLEIQLVGQTNSTEEYMVNRDGSISIDDFGKIKISGLKLGDAIELIESKISASFIGTRALISLTNIRDVNVLVSGNAFNPGVYTLNGNSNILNALSAAGGINEYGTYRKIQLLRNNQIIEDIDLYDVLVTGRFDSATRLRSGDVIFIGAVKKLVTIDGAVKRPAIYEMQENQNLIDILDYANGVTVDADLKNISLNRILDGDIKSIQIINVSQFKNIVANDADRILIRRFPFRTVEINGSVLNPGQYMVSEGETISDLVKKAGGYTKNAYPFGAVFENIDALEINKAAKSILYTQFLDNIILASQQNPTGDLDLTSIIKLTENLKKVEPNGRIVIDLYNDNNSNDVILRDGDVLSIPEKNNHVYVFGEVSSEGALIYKDNTDVTYYLKKSGGLKDSANGDRIYVLQPNGVTEKYSSKRNLFASSQEDIKLYPGSVIFVPREINNKTAQRLAAQAYATILGNIGVSLASISALKD